MLFIGGGPVRLTIEERMNLLEDEVARLNGRIEYLEKVNTIRGEQINNLTEGLGKVAMIPVNALKAVKKEMGKESKK